MKCVTFKTFCLPFHREIIENTKTHIDIFEELLRNGNWGVVIPPIPSPPILPPRKLMVNIFLVIIFLLKISLIGYYWNLVFIFFTEFLLELCSYMIF